MKCIHCGSDTKYKDRQSNGYRCAACKHPFAFEPKNAETLGIADGLFQRTVQDVSGDDTVFFTEGQLWYEFNRRLLRKQFWRAPWGWVAGVGGAGSVVAASLLSVGWPIAIGAGCIALGAAMSHRTRKKLPARTLKIPWDVFRGRYLGRWAQIHGSPPRLLTAPAPRRAGSSSSPPPDVTAYSFDRALVTETGDIAAMLVANNFHFENNCAILSADGYPEEIRDTVLTMLRRNPQLVVFALHDASPVGCALPARLRGDDWFPDHGVRIVDLGLRPQHAQQMGLIVRTEAAPSTLDPNPALTPEETHWLLAGSVAELAAIRPARLMRAVYQGFARANQMGTDGSSTSSDGGSADGGIWFFHSGSDVYASDSFG